MPDEITSTKAKRPIAKLPLAACIVALFGLCDAIYLTVHHYTAVPVPCTLTGEGCEMVLSSSWSEIGTIPLAAFGAAAYFVAFALAMLTAFGDRRMWRLYGVLVTMMAAFSAWLLYVQAFRIHAFCQFCLLSAATSFTLFIIFLISLFLNRSARS